MLTELSHITAASQMGGTRLVPFSEWAGGVHGGVYSSRGAEQAEDEVDANELKLGFRDAEGYEITLMSGGGTTVRRLPEDGDAEDDESK